VYAALPDELDTAPLIALAQERGCRLYCRASTGGVLRAPCSSWK